MARILNIPIIFQESKLSADTVTEKMIIGKQNFLEPTKENYIIPRIHIPHVFTFLELQCIRPFSNQYPKFSTTGKAKFVF